MDFAPQMFEIAAKKNTLPFAKYGFWLTNVSNSCKITLCVSQNMDFGSQMFQIAAK
jgi:hypothetical protein